jgi:hypothetical protein
MTEAKEGAPTACRQLKLAKLTGLGAGMRTSSQLQVLEKRRKKKKVSVKR